MNPIAIAIVAVVAWVVGGVLGWFFAHVRAGAVRARLTAELHAEKRATAEKVAVLEQARDQLREAFDAACHKALQANNQAFLDLAQTKMGEFQQSARSDLEERQKSINDIVRPVRDGLEEVGNTLRKLDVDRVQSQAAIQQQLKSMVEHSQHLAGETENLVRALRTPQVRGRWGEMQLKRVVELAGMAEHCDFTEQQTVQSEDGRLRPDLLVNLPGRKVVVVDAKTPLDAFLDAAAAQNDSERKEALDRHARQVRDHIRRLSNKEYAKQFAEAPDFVVMFLPGEALFSAACQRDPSLIDDAVKSGVILASPTTLITVLKAVAFGWQQERLAASAEELRDLGAKLYDRVRMLAEHLGGIRKGLERAVDAYNGTVASLESRFLPVARRIGELGVRADGDIPILEPVDQVPRLLAAPELTAVPMSSSNREPEKAVAVRV